MPDPILPVMVVLLQTLSLTGVWAEIFSARSRNGDPPLSRFVLICAVCSGSAYFLAGLNSQPYDLTKIVIGAASVMTCGTNLSQWYVKTERYALGMVFLAEFALLGLLGLSVRMSGTMITDGLIYAPLVFVMAQGGGRLCQIVRFWRAPPKSASLVLWCSNVALNATLIFYHQNRSETFWVAANIGSGTVGTIVLLQIILYRLRLSHVTTDVGLTVVKLDPKMTPDRRRA